MKILVLSLLRIGDIVMAAPVLRALRESHPDDEIHLLINSQFRQITPLLPYINRIIFFDRERLQRGLGEVSVPVFDSYERLSELVDELNGSSYDRLVNLTQNRLSGWLMSVLNCNDVRSGRGRIGLCLDSHGRASFGSPWFKYLNSQVEADGCEVFHFADVFRFALDLGDESSRRPALVETVVGRREAEAFLEQAQIQDFIAVQTLTSDAKKDWGFARYAEAIVQIARVHPGVKFAVLGAPFEREKLQPLMSLLSERGVRAELAILGFEGVFSLLRKAKLLLTGDTSVKHLAHAARTPVVEVSLGSSDLYRTGAYHHDSIIIQSKEVCAPCIHSKPCHRDTHACATKTVPEVVAMVACEVYDRRFFQLRSIAEEFVDAVEIFRVDHRTLGFWVAHSVTEVFSEMTVGRWLDLVCRRIWLTSPEGGMADNIGTETLRLRRFFQKIHSDISEIEWRHLFSDFERQILLVESRMNGFKIGLQYLRGGYEDPRKMVEFVRGLISLREKIRHAPLLRSFKGALDQVIEDDMSSPFTRYRRISDLVSEIERRVDIHLRLVRGLAQNHDSETGMERT